METKTETRMETNTSKKTATKTATQTKTNMEIKVKENIDGMTANVEVTLPFSVALSNEFRHSLFNEIVTPVFEPIPNCVYRNNLFVSREVLELNFKLLPVHADLHKYRDLTASINVGNSKPEIYTVTSKDITFTLPDGINIENPYRKLPYGYEICKLGKNQHVAFSAKLFSAKGSQHAAHQAIARVSPPIPTGDGRCKLSFVSLGQMKPDILIREVLCYLSEKLEHYIQNVNRGILNIENVPWRRFFCTLQNSPVKTTNESVEWDKSQIPEIVKELQSISNIVKNCIA
jgi:hypothetical protein